MKHKIRRSLFIAILCFLVGITIIVVNYALDNTGGKGYSSGNMNTLSDYHRSLGMIISAIVLATASVVMMIMSIISIMRRKQAEDEELLRQLDEEEAKAALEESDATED